MDTCKWFFSVDIHNNDDDDAVEFVIVLQSKIESGGRLTVLLALGIILSLAKHEP